MTESKETPVKVYAKSIPKSTCRLCCGICDPKHAKVLFRERNVGLLRLAERVFGGKLVSADHLPRFLCRPCERRLVNLGKFRDLVCKNQASLLQKKRCTVDMSPSLPTAKKKKSKDVSGRTRESESRRTLFFSNEEVHEVRLLTYLTKFQIYRTLKRLNYIYRLVIEPVPQTPFRLTHLVAYGHPFRFPKFWRL